MTQSSKRSYRYCMKVLHFCVASVSESVFYLQKGFFSIARKLYILLGIMVLADKKYGSAFSLKWCRRQWCSSTPSYLLFFQVLKPIPQPKNTVVRQMQLILIYTGCITLMVASTLRRMALFLLCNSSSMNCAVFYGFDLACPLGKPIVECFSTQPTGICTVIIQGSHAHCMKITC